MNYHLLTDEELERIAYLKNDPLAIELARRLLEARDED
jgi:hypothetical protein